MRRLRLDSAEKLPCWRLAWTDGPGGINRDKRTQSDKQNTKVVWWVTTASCLLDFVTIYSVRAAPLITVITNLPASWARSCLAETLGMLWRCLLLPWQQSGWSGCYPLLQPLHHWCPLLPPGDRLADPTGYGTLVTQKGQKRKWTHWIRDNKGIRYKFLVRCRKPRKWICYGCNRDKKSRGQNYWKGKLYTHSHACTGLSLANRLIPPLMETLQQLLFVNPLCTIIRLHS